jgi:uncharacterized Ntn-hydrolase superfamily protein
VGFDAETGDLGVAVASKFFAVGAVVPFAKSGVGAVATQSYANTSYGRRAFELLSAGLSPAATLTRLTSDDTNPSVRQVGIVDASGRSANYTGSDCHAWAGGITGEAFAIQGNLLVGEAVVVAMASAFRDAVGELAERLVSALVAGEEAGGDKRGKQSAALVVARRNGGFGGFDDRYVDLRVDDHVAPVTELRRLLDIRFGRG